MNRLVFAACLLFWSSGLSAGGKVESIGPFTDTASESVKGALEPKGYRVSLGDGTVVCEIWLRDNVPGLSEATLVGVVSFPKAWTDFRKQNVKAGVYTLRYAKIPSDGNHLGASPTPDFLLLIPQAADTDVNAKPSFQDLAKMSAKTVHTNHPSPMSLASAASQKEFPAVGVDELQHDVLYVKAKTGSGELPLALVVKGVTELD